LIKKYVEENEIERPQDFIVKSVVNKSSQKFTLYKASTAECRSRHLSGKGNRTRRTAR
jgi:hypothetical protein